MSASANRREVRVAKRELARRGCTCHPRFDVYGRAMTKATGATFGAAIRHEVGCTLGDQVAELNRAGWIPVVDYFHPNGCER